MRDETVYTGEMVDVFIKDRPGAAKLTVNIHGGDGNGNVSNVLSVTLPRNAASSVPDYVVPILKGAGEDVAIIPKPAPVTPEPPAETKTETPATEGQEGHSNG